MKLRYLVFSLVFVFGLGTVGACKHQTCPTYATSGPTKRKKSKKKKKSAPWHKKNSMKKGKKGSTPQ